MSASLSGSYNLVEDAESGGLSAASSSSATDSLPSSPSSGGSALDSDGDEAESESQLGEESDAEREWKESLRQLELVLMMVVVPFVGKYFGRRCAYWGWTKFMEWKYPVEVVVTSQRSFRAAGIIEAASPL